MDFDVVFIIGPQGSGKGTQGKILAGKLGFLFWDMGAVLRETGREGTPLGKKIAGLIGQGILLSDDMIIEVSKEKLAAIPPTQGIIFDGVPRRLGQADFLLNFLRGQQRKEPVTIFINLPREESFNRLLLRAKKEGRNDDTPKRIETRLRYYDEAVKPTVDYLREKTRFIEIDGLPSVPEVTKSIDAALGLTRTNAEKTL